MAFFLFRFFRFLTSGVDTMATGQRIGCAVAGRWNGPAISRMVVLENALLGRLGLAWSVEAAGRAMGTVAAATGRVTAAVAGRVCDLSGMPEAVRIVAVAGRVGGT